MTYFDFKNVHLIKQISNPTDLYFDFLQRVFTKYWKNY